MNLTGNPVALTIMEKKTDYYIAIKIPGKDADSVIAALEVLREEYGNDRFPNVFKTITANNGSEFERLSELEL
jgi:IS30 family transposase